MERLPFTLTSETQGAPPYCGETAGEALRYGAEALLEKAQRVTGGPVPALTRLSVAFLYSLAADAYRAAAGASIGHNRADRYSAEARRLGALADDLMAQD